MTDILEERRYTSQEAAELLGISLSTLRWHRHQGTGPRGFRLGRRVFYAESDLRSWVEAAYDAGIDPIHPGLGHIEQTLKTWDLS